MAKTTTFSACIVTAFLVAGAAMANAPTFQELMRPDVFPQPQCGMVIEGASLDQTAWRVTTTGAQVTTDLRSGVVTLEQRIGHRRALARVYLGRALGGARMTHHTPGLARATFLEPRMTVRINGDSLCMIHAREPVTVTVEPLIAPAWSASYGSNHLVVDEWGGFGLYCSETTLDDHFDPYAAIVACYELPANAVLWVSACPPKPYPWERSLRDNVVWHWSDQLAYPPDAVLREWQPYGNIVLLQSEVMLWKDWNLDFVPRLGPEEFARVRKTLHDMGMRFIVYTSPYYFLKGTALADHAMSSFENFKGWPPGTDTGENIDLFMSAITRMVGQHQPDGLYFDGQYISSPAALYALSRRARALLGEDGILEWHSTVALGSGDCYLPQADAYVDFILRGEGANRRYTDPDYMRFFISGYNISNSIGVVCNNSGGINADLVRRALDVNARFHTIAGWIHDPPSLTAVQDYRAQLTPDLRAAVDRGVDQRQALVAERIARYQAERAALDAQPAWGHASHSVTFDRLPDVKQIISPANPAPFSVADGALVVKARPHTYAYLSLPLNGKTQGMIVKLRQGTDGGMSWGPAALLRFADGATIRVGTRSDGQLQADILGRQLVGGAYDPQRWVWLRARWLDHWGLIERSDDGVSYEVVWHFDHGGALNGDVRELLVGKVPYNGEPADYAVDGPVGDCAIGLVEVY